MNPQGQLKTPNNSSIHLKWPLPSCSDLAISFLLPSALGCHRAVCHLLLQCIWEEIKCFMGKESPWNHISYLLIGKCWSNIQWKMSERSEIPAGDPHNYCAPKTTIIGRCHATTQLCDPNDFLLNFTSGPILSLKWSGLENWEGIVQLSLLLSPPTPSACNANSKWARREWLELSFLNWFISFFSYCLASKALTVSYKYDSVCFFVQGLITFCCIGLLFCGPWQLLICD